MSTSKQAFGRWGEATAAVNLQSHGYAILARNAHTPHAEIDIVANKDGSFTFVEAKFLCKNNFRFLGSEGEDRLEYSNRSIASE